MKLHSRAPMLSSPWTSSTFPRRTLALPRPQCPSLVVLMPLQIRIHCLYFSSYSLIIYVSYSCQFHNSTWCHITNSLRSITVAVTMFLILSSLRLAPLHVSFSHCTDKLFSYLGTYNSPLRLWAVHYSFHSLSLPDLSISFSFFLFCFCTLDLYTEIISSACTCALSINIFTTASQHTRTHTQTRTCSLI